MPLPSDDEGRSVGAAEVRGRPSREEAESAVRVLIAWAGDDPTREGLRDTPARVVRSYEEMFSGYAMNPRFILSRTFGEAAGYQEPVILKNIELTSCCEHHMLPVTGKAHIGYLPNKRVVGISKLSRVVEVFARRLQIQERLVVEIAEAIQEAIDPRGVAVIVEAEHSCMTLRGVKAPGAAMICSHFTGDFRGSAGLRADFMRMVGP